MDEMLKLKNQLKAYLERNGMTASQLARRASVPKQTISHWLAGGQPRRLEQLRKVADAMGTSIDSLCFGDSSLPPSGTDNPFQLLNGHSEWISGIFELKIRKIHK